MFQKYKPFQNALLFILSKSINLFSTFGSSNFEIKSFASGAIFGKSSICLMFLVLCLFLCLFVFFVLFMFSC